MELEPSRPTTTVRSLTSLAAACVASALLAGCGSGQANSVSGASTGSTSPPPGSLASSTVSGAPLRPTRAQALAFAHAVNLDASDVPGASVQVKERRASAASERRELRHCERDFERPDTLVEATSPRLRRGRELEVEQISSSVTVLSSERAVARQFSLLASSALRKCAARALTRSLADKPVSEAHWGRVTVSKLPVRAPGTSATVGIRIVATLNFPVSEVSLPVYVDVLGFAEGPAEVALSTVSVTQPVPATTEQELLALLLTRARARPL